MKKTLLKGRKLLLIAALMALLVIGCVLSASAEELSWNLLSETNSGYTIDNYSVYKRGQEAGGTPYLYNENSAHGALYIFDKQNIMGGYVSFSLEGDFYFESFPTGIRLSSDKTKEFTPKTEPLSFLSWLYRDIETQQLCTYDGLRLDDEGFLYTRYGNKVTKTDTQLRPKKWYNIRCVFSPGNGACEVFIDNEQAFNFTITRFDSSKYLSGAVRYFDNYYNYGVKMKNLYVKTDDAYTVSLDREETADYFGYQTTKPADGKYSARLLLGVNGLDWNRVGYEIIKLTRNKAGDLVAENLSARAKTVYDYISTADGSGFYTADDFGVPYMAALEVEGLPAEPTAGFMELVVRPYALGLDGIRRYGVAVSLIHTSEVDEEGYPLFIKSVGKTLKVTSNADTYVYNSTKDHAKNFGGEYNMPVRNTGDESSELYRAVYYQFKLSADAVRALDSAISANLRVFISKIEEDPARQRYEMILHATESDWGEMELTHDNSEELATPIEELYYGDFNVGEYTDFDILPYLKEQVPDADGTLTVSFRFINEGHADAKVATFRSRESSDAPYIEITNSLYTINLNPEKTANKGYDPWGYAEYLVDEWFDKLRDEVYTKDANGNIIYHDEYGSLNPNGYNATEATGDFTREFKWKTDSPWNTDPEKGYVEPDSAFRENRFGRTLATLGTSTANAFLSSEYANIISEYDNYGGIANAGIKGKVTGFFHTERIGERTYIIDPMGNPFFAMGINTVGLGESNNQNLYDYSLAKFGDDTTFYNEITAGLKDAGLNVVWVSGQAANTGLLDVRRGLSVVISVKGVDTYMNFIGRGKIAENLYPHGNTINVFDPDFVTEIFRRNEEYILDNNYADNPYVFGFIADNELPSGADLLERYLRLDTSEPTNAFSYATAWAWLARRMNTAYPSLDEYLASPDQAEINDEFLSFLYSRHYKVIGDSIKAVAPNHMYMGSRVHGFNTTSEGYLRAAGRFLDIVTINLYGGLNPDAEMVSNFYRYTGKPFIVTEFFAKGMDAIDANGYKLANSTGAGILVETQQDRADYFEHYTLAMLESKACVGVTWYRFRDNDQGIYRQVGGDRELIMLHMSYGVGAHPNTLMDVETGEILTAAQVGEYETIYKGEGLASNQNVNKGIYNTDYSSDITVYTYDKDGKLLNSSVFEVKPHETGVAVDGDLLISADGKKAYIIGREDMPDGTYTETVLSTHEGRYVQLASAMRNIGDHIMGLIRYFDAK